MSSEFANIVEEVKKRESGFLDLGIRGLHLIKFIKRAFRRRIKGKSELEKKFWQRTEIFKNETVNKEYSS